MCTGLAGKQSFCLYLMHTWYKYQVSLCFLTSALCGKLSNFCSHHVFNSFLALISVPGYFKTAYSYTLKNGLTKWFLKETIVFQNDLSSVIYCKIMANHLLVAVQYYIHFKNRLLSGSLIKLQKDLFNIQS